MREGVNFIGIELDDDGTGKPIGYMEIARARIGAALREVAEVAAIAAAATEPVNQDLFTDLTA